MSEEKARGCDGKKRIKSSRRAGETAKLSQARYGIPMHSYPCKFCKGWHVGSYRQEERRMVSREDHQILQMEKFGLGDRREKLYFGKLRYGVYL